jgi:hypothetical protein
MTGKQAILIPPLRAMVPSVVPILCWAAGEMRCWLPWILKIKFFYYTNELI